MSVLPHNACVCGSIDVDVTFIKSQDLFHVICIRCNKEWVE